MDRHQHMKREMSEAWCWGLAVQEFGDAGWLNDEMDELISVKVK